MNIKCIIPARYGSDRFRGKPLALIAGKPMVLRVCENAGKAHLLDEVIVATDDAGIYETVTGAGVKCIMTPACGTGTDRVYWVSKRIKAGIVVNVQGDEPMISPAVIDGTIRAFLDSGGAGMATAAVRMKDSEGLTDPDIVKVVVDSEGRALYFSRSPIPSTARDAGKRRRPYSYLKHIGIYVYGSEFLKVFCGLKKSRLEEIEKLEQLRALENGFGIRVALTDRDCISVDRKEDIKYVEAAMKRLRGAGV